MTSPLLSVLAEEITQTRGVMASATELINGFAQRIADAITAALVNGATEAELEPFRQLEVELEESRNALAAAVAANPR